MPNRQFFGCLPHLVRAPVAYVQGIKAGLKARRDKQPATPMTDQELARAIREFQASSVPERPRRERSDGREGT